MKLEFPVPSGSGCWLDIGHSHFFVKPNYDVSSIFCMPENVIVLGDNVLVNFAICSSINFSIVFCALSLGNSHMTVEIWGVCGLRHAVNRTPLALPIRSGQRVCKIDSKSSHSSVEGKVLMKIFVNMVAHFLVERNLNTF